jgi:eukaryotic-like serine/threonine-protein kinase
MIAPGTLLQNRYLVERQIGQGGMGSVYVATDQRFGSTVAIKETLFDDPSLRRAFEREARLLNRLRHSALPRVSDHFEEGAGQFLVMEFIPGEDLSDLLKGRGRPFPARDALAWADQLLDALEYLHTQEPPVIHRDIKPQNLKLLPRNQIVLLDFGLAKGTPLQTRVTATGSVFGYSFNYAPIEQMQGAGTDPRSDLYSLGATLYHLLTGAPPPDALTRATAVLNGEPDPLRPAGQAAPRVPETVADVLSRAMALSAAGRFASAGEMREALRLAGASVAEGDGATEAAAAGGAATVASSEQETRLLKTGGAAPQTSRGARERETGVAVSAGAATLVNTEVAGGATLVGQGRGGEASVLTRVVPQDQPASGRGRSSRRALGVAAGVVAAAVVGVAAYSLTGGEPAPAPAPQVRPRPEAEAAAPAPVTAESQQPAEPPTAAPTPEAADAPAPQTRQAQRAAPKSPPDRAREGDAAGARHPPLPPAPPRGAAHAVPDDLGPEFEREMERSFEGRDWVNRPLTREEMQVIIRRAEQRRRRAQETRRRLLREQRRQPQPPQP